MKLSHLLTAAAVALTLAACDDPATTPDVHTPAAAHPRRLASPGVFPESSPYGINVTYGDDPRFMPAMYDSIKSAGIGWIRLDFNWNEYTDANGQWIQAREDLQRQAVLMAKARGLNIYASINYTPQWASGSSDVHYPPLPSQWGSYQLWVQKIVTDFPEVKYWGIWNEPNCDGFFKGTEADYHNLVAYAAPVIHAHGGRVVAPDLAYELSLSSPSDQKCHVYTSIQQWLANLLNSQGDNIDVVSVHAYGDANIIGNHLATDTFVTQVQARLSGKPWRWPLWLTETGRGGGGLGPNDTIPWADMSSHLQTIMSRMNGRTSGSRWEKTFYYHLDTEADNHAGIFGNYSQVFATGNPAYFIPKTAYWTYKSIATGYVPAQQEIAYQPHQSYLGWQNEVHDSATAGSTSATYALEAVKIRLVDMPTGSGVAYQTYVQNQGWQAEVANGAVSGTTGQGAQLEGIKIHLTGAPAGTQVCYNAYVPTQGWQGTRCDGAVAGVVAAGKVISALQVWIVDPGEDPGACVPAPGQFDCES